MVISVCFMLTVWEPWCQRGVVFNWQSKYCVLIIFTPFTLDVQTNITWYVNQTLQTVYNMMYLIQHRHKVLYFIKGTERTAATM